MLGSVEMLEQRIRECISIPAELANNVITRTTGMGGVFVEYYSDSRGGVDTLNSLVQIRFAFDTTDGAGRYIGDDVGIEVTTYRNITPMRGIRKKQPYIKVVDKLNNWLFDNREYLFRSIQY